MPFVCFGVKLIFGCFGLLLLVDKSGAQITVALVILYRLCGVLFPAEACCHLILFLVDISVFLMRHLRFLVDISELFNPVLTFDLE
jgi:hypothetical protein